MPKYDFYVMLSRVECFSGQMGHVVLFAAQQYASDHVFLELFTRHPLAKNLAKELIPLLDYNHKGV